MKKFIDSVHIDNFNPVVKKHYPGKEFKFIPTKVKKIWVIFSEEMDTSTIDTSTVHIKSLKDGYNYSITNLFYSNETLYIFIDSLRFKDSVQVILSGEIKDLAGKGLDTTQIFARQPAGYSWWFVVGLLQITDNDVDDFTPDVWHGKISWVQGNADVGTGNIMFYNFYQDTSFYITTDGGYWYPKMYKDTIAFLRTLGGNTNAIYFYDGNSSNQVSPFNRWRSFIDIGRGGIIAKSFKMLNSTDSVFIEIYDFQTSSFFTIDTFIRWYYTPLGTAVTDGEIYVWDAWNLSEDREILIYEEGIKNNLSQDTTQDDNFPRISYGQVIWIKGNINATSTVYFFDGAEKRMIPNSEGGHFWPALCIDNGIIAYVKDETQAELHLFNGRKDTIIYKANYPPPPWITGPAIKNLSLHNSLLGFLWVRKEYLQGGYVYTISNPLLYEKDKILKFIDDTLRNSNRIEIHDGFVVFDAWDGNDYEIYLYISDTLFTPPAPPRNLSAKDSIGNIYLTWNANKEPDLKGYLIYKSDSSYSYPQTPYDTVFAPETTYVDTSPFTGANYYVVTAFDSLYNESGFSNQAMAFIPDTTPPLPPSNLSAVYDSLTKSVYLIWNSSGDADLKLYRIYRSETSGGYTTPLDSVFAPDTTYNDTNIFFGKTYYYVVSAVDTAGNESNFSNEDSARVPIELYSDYKYATGFNNSKRIVKMPTGEIFLAYISKDTIF